MSCPSLEILSVLAWPEVCPAANRHCCIEAPAVICARHASPTVRTGIDSGSTMAKSRPSGVILVLSGDSPRMPDIPRDGLNSLLRIGVYLEDPTCEKWRAEPQGDILGFGRCQTLALRSCHKAWACNA